MKSKIVSYVLIAVMTVGLLVGGLCYGFFPKDVAGQNFLRMFFNVLAWAGILYLILYFLRAIFRKKTRPQVAEVLQQGVQSSRAILLGYLKFMLIWVVIVVLVFFALLFSFEFRLT